MITKNYPISRFVAVLFCILIMGASVSLAQEKVVRVGTIHSPPLCFAPEPNQEPTGFFIDIIKEISKREGWTLEFTYGTHSQNIRRLKDAEIDLLVAQTPTPETDHHFNFTDTNVLSTWAQVYAYGNDILSPLNLKGLNVGIVSQDPYYSGITSTLKRFNVDCNFVEFKSYESVFRALDEKWIDCGVVDHLFGLQNAYAYTFSQTPIVFSPIELRFAVTPSNPYNLAAVLDYHLRDLKDNPKSIYHKKLKQIKHQGMSSGLPKWLYLGFLGGGALLVLFLALNLLLRHQVKVKTQQLWEKNYQLEGENRKRAHAENALRHSNEILEQTFSSMYDGLMVVNTQKQIIEKCNRVAESLFGYPVDTLKGKPFAPILDQQEAAQDLLQAVVKSLKTEGFWKGEMDLMRQDGSNFSASVVVTPLQNQNTKTHAWVVVIRDISEQLRTSLALKQAQEQLQQSQKLEAIGTLAAGIAHDFNNLLQPIIGFAELLKMKFSATPEIDIEKPVNHIISAGMRGRELVNQILEFSRHKKSEKIPVHIGNIVKESVKLLQATIPATTQIHLSINTSNDCVRGDITQIHQVIMNLCTNAIHAMKQKGGTLSVVLDSKKGDLPDWRVDGTAPIEPCLHLSVSDTGTGISDENLKRIFDPFFTTKATNEGTGMGLSVALGVVKDMNGAITVESEWGKGTTFHVFLPLTTELATTASAPSKPLIKGKNENILFVDDEEPIRALAERALPSLGYNVITVADPHDALAIFEDQMEEIDMLITDLDMPGMSGLELIGHVKDLYPSLPIIMCTGYADNVTTDKLRELGLRDLIYKPVTPEELAGRIRTAFDFPTLQPHLEFV